MIILRLTRLRLTRFVECIAKLRTVSEWNQFSDYELSENGLSRQEMNARLREFWLSDVAEKSRSNSSGIAVGHKVRLRHGLRS